MKTLYGILKPDGELEMIWNGENLYATTNRRYAKRIADLSGKELVKIEVNYFFITPKRRAKTADKEGKQMAKANKAVPKAPAKVPAKKGKK